MSQSSASRIKHEQKKSLLFRALSNLVAELALEEPTLTKIFLTRVELSSGEGLCTVYFYSNEGRAAFDQALAHLKLYKPSLRSALAKVRQARHTPDLKFAYDEAFEKERHIHELLDEIQAEGSDEE